MKELKQLVETVKALRDPQSGCPWDLEQNHQSLIPYLLEESYEFIAAVELDDPKEMEEEIGDVLLQVLLHCAIGDEKKLFSINTVAENLNQKLIRRHPHVFENNGSVSSVEQVEKKWQQIKNEERPNQSLMPLNLLNSPALQSSYKIGKKAQKVQFDWPDLNGVLDKVDEELAELKEQLNQKSIDIDHVDEELGDLLFSIAQLARKLDLNPEQTLRNANQKFLKRFHQMESLIKKDQVKVDSLDLKKWEHYWSRVKSEK